MIILGDVHGDIETCRKLAKENPKQTIVQLGDLGIGFKVPVIIGHKSRWEGKPVWQAALSLPANFRFFVGNHDNRDLASDMANCLGDFGEFKKIFFVSGADSMDKNQRVEGVSWWRNEELTTGQANKCLDLWLQSKAKILVAHDCPQQAAEGTMLIYDRCITRDLLREMVNRRQPELVIFGHHHKSMRFKIDGVQYICLAVGEHIKI